MVRKLTREEPLTLVADAPVTLAFAGLFMALALVLLVDRRGMTV